MRAAAAAVAAFALLVAASLAACLACYGTWAAADILPKDAQRVFSGPHGNFTIREAGGRVELVNYDADGGERVTVLRDIR
jgi:hypothetical protein